MKRPVPYTMTLARLLGSAQAHESMAADTLVRAFWADLVGALYGAWRFEMEAAEREAEIARAIEALRIERAVLDERREELRGAA